MKSLARLAFLAMVASSGAAAHEADRYVVLCTDPSTATACEAGTKKARALYEKAYRGNYQAQRDLAFALQKGSFPVRKDPVGSCTWRLIIISSGSPKVNSGDQANMNQICGRLSAADLGWAKGEAVTLTRRMVMGEAMDTDVIDTSGLDSTAEPLTAE